MKINIQRKRSKKLTTPNTSTAILTMVIGALAATIVALIAKLRAAADPEKRAVEVIREGVDRLKHTIEKTPDSIRWGSPALRAAGSQLDAVRAAVDQPHTENGIRTTVQ